jgi:hypothetical protein
MFLKLVPNYKVISYIILAKKVIEYSSDTFYNVEIAVGGQSQLTTFG